MSSLARFLHLPPAERRLVLEAARGLLRERVRVALHRSGTGRLRASPGRSDAQTAAQVGRAVRRAAQVVGGKCLAQALAGERMLARRGLHREVRVGVRRDAGFTAHAWLLHEDQVLLGGPLDGQDYHTLHRDS